MSAAHVGQHWQQPKGQTMTNPTLDIIARNRAGYRVSIPSICSAHPEVLRATLGWAKRKNKTILIEATSNQVNQDGGYTGKTPAQFIRDIHGLAQNMGVDSDQIILGGDHLGPQAWRHLPADHAMAKARDMVAEYVAAGFEKIHLDCSEGCAGEPAQLSDDITARRSSELASICEAAVPKGAELPKYVIGTEVPPPGGARIDEHGDIPATIPTAAMDTLAAHQAAFESNGLGDIITRVIGLVVQPGVEFSPMHVHQFPLDRDPALRSVMMSWPNLCLEAHSTDYQNPQVYPLLAALGFALQKVGPALTFAYRQAVYGLDMALGVTGKSVGLMETMTRVMQAQPKFWQGHYPTDDRYALHFGYADRIRYYWPDPAVQSSITQLQENIDAAAIPDPVLQQFFAPSVLERAELLSGSQFTRLVHAQIEIALDPYDIHKEGDTA